MNGSTLTLGLVGALAAAGALSRRGSAALEDCRTDAPKILYHLTKKKRFAPDPNYGPIEGVNFMTGTREPSLFVTDDPSYWLKWRGGKANVAVLDVSRLCFGHYHPVPPRERDRIEREEAKVRVARKGFTEAYEAFVSSLLLDGQPMPERIRGEVMSLAPAGSYPARSFFQDNPEVRQKARATLDLLVQEGFASRTSVEQAIRRVGATEHAVALAERDADALRSNIQSYDAYIPRDGRYPEYIVFPSAHDKPSVIETLPFKHAEAKYRNHRREWKTK